MENWKTTVAGVGAAVAVSMANVLTAVSSGTPMDWKSILTALGIAIVGYFAHDAKPSAK